MFIPGITFEYGDEIINDNLPFCPIAGLDSFLAEWVRQIGTSSESRVVTGDEFSQLTKLLNKGNFPRNLKANNIESIATTLLKYNFTSDRDIAEFLIMRGADNAMAIQVGSLLAKKMDMLRYLSSVSSFSFVGEGFTDKSQDRIDALTQFVEATLDNHHPFSQMVRAVAYQYMRTAPLWRVENGKLVINRRRKVYIHITNRTVLEFLAKGVSSQQGIESDVYQQMLRDSIYFDDIRGEPINTRLDFT